MRIDLDDDDLAEAITGSSYFETAVESIFKDQAEELVNNAVDNADIASQVSDALPNLDDFVSTDDHQRDIEEAREAREEICQEVEMLKAKIADIEDRLAGALKEIEGLSYHVANFIQGDE